MRRIPSVSAGRAVFSFFLLIAICTGLCEAQTTLSQDLVSKIDRAAQEVLHETGVPSASVAVVRDGKIAYLQAYGDARLEPKTPARPEMRYSIGSISKQFTAASMLLLQEDGKLSVDDPVGKYVPNLTRANEVTIRQLLSHTSGYQDYWPQDYVPPIMMQPITSEKILDMWARKPLDFDPGTRWQYSNTNYVIAGVIVEKVSGMPLLQFLQTRVFNPLGMKSVANIDQEKLGDTDATGYMRYALGPPRLAPKEGKGWLFAAGELAMPTADLARWDISMMDQKLLKPASYQEMENEVRLKNGLGTQYGLGVDITSFSDHRMLSHGGEVSGFTTQNNVFPDDRAAVIVLTNQDAARASGDLARRISALLFTTEDATAKSKTEQARKIFEGLQHGTIDRSLFTDNANSYFDGQALKDFASSLGPLGMPLEFLQSQQALRGGMTLRVYRIKFHQQGLRAWTFEMPDGKLEQYQVS
ncbi:MAG TPA: serine hydrolase domain-containing protein, partial [Terriglobales bacterium]|nr:serine hydrolase domain-containing protein [Terriglobales bacterium]